MNETRPDVIEVTDAPASARTLTDLLAALGHPLNARCGQRGLCRGCMVELIEGTVLDAAGRAAATGLPVRSCQLRLPPGGRARVRVLPQARIGRAAQVGETFRVDVPCGLSPLFPPQPGKDTGFAVDVGTTTVVVLLADLATGEVLSRAGDFSAQIRFGDNVISRIASAACPQTRREMRRVLVAETLAPLLEKACARARRDVSRLAGGTLAGNTTMLHILADVDPTPLGIAPFTAPFLEGRCLRSAEIGLLPDVPLQLLPGLAAYLGADITGGVHATGMTLDPAPGLLVDLGTNGEVVLCRDGLLIGCATAAGPAFEGAGLSCGTRAQNGAVSGISMTHDPFTIELETIAGRPPQAGICGSAYIDFLAAARSCGLLRGNGRFDPARWAAVPASQRLENDDGSALLLGGNPGPSISEIDIAHLLQAKAAIGAGIETLLGAAKVAPAEIGRVDLAGGFGLHVNVSNAIAIGLLPGFRPQQVRVVGNTALAGALVALLDHKSLPEMESLRSGIEALELNVQPGFEDRYIDHLALP